MYYSYNMGCSAVHSSQFSTSDSTFGIPLSQMRHMFAAAREGFVAPQALSFDVAAPSMSAQDKQARKADARRLRQKRKDYAKQLTKTGREPIEIDIEAMVCMLRMYCRCTGDTLRKAARLRSSGAPVTGLWAGTSGEAW